MGSETDVIRNVSKFLIARRMRLYSSFIFFTPSLTDEKGRLHKSEQDTCSCSYLSVDHDLFIILSCLLLDVHDTVYSQSDERTKGANSSHEYC